MKSYRGTSVKARLVAAALTLAIVAGLLEAVAEGFLQQDEQTIAARREWNAARAEQAARSRALADGRVKSASYAAPGI